MNSLSASFLAVIVLASLIQTVHPRKQISRFCGPTITEDGLMFHGRDHIILPNQDHNANNFSLVQFAFTTTVADGLLLFISASGSPLASQSLGLADGKLVFRSNLGPGSPIIISKEHYDDGKWHDLEAKWLFEHFDLTIDGILVSSTLVPQSFNKLYDDSVTYIGGFKEIRLLQGMKGFRGFLRNIRLENATFDLDSHLRKSNCHKAIDERRRRRRETMKNNCNADVQLTATYVGSTNIVLSWSSTNCCMEYRVHSNELDTESTNESYRTKDHHIEIKQLQEGVSYEFTLFDEDGVYLTNISNKTGHPPSLIVDDVTESTIELSLELLNDTFSEAKLTVSGKTQSLTGTRHKISDLEPGSAYEVKLSVGAWNTIRTVKTRGIFLNNFKCNDGKSAGEIYCSWGTESGSDCDGIYQLNFSNPFSTLKSFLLNSSNYLPNSFSTEHVLQQHGQNYSISIRYIADNYSSKIETATAIAKTGISKYFFHRSANCSNESIILNYWKDSAGMLIEYYIINGMIQSHNLSPNNSVVFDNLKAGHHYELTAVAVSNGVESERLKTNVSTVPNPPSMVECINHTATTLTVNIGPAEEEGGFDRYKISVNGTEISDNSIQEEKRAVDGTITTVKNLNPFTNYKVCAKYLMNFKNLPSEQQCEVRFCQTAQGKSGKVGLIRNTENKTDEFNIVWDPPSSPNGIITEYVVKVSRFQLNLTFHPKETRLKIPIDNPGKGHFLRYRIEVAAINSAGVGEVQFQHFHLLEIPDRPTLLIASLLILSFLLIVLIGLLVFYFIRISPTRMQSMRRLSSRLMSPANEMRYFKQPSVSSKPVKISNFVAYVERLEKDSGLKLTEEYEDLKFVGRNQSKDEAELQCNRVKNRFTNILPYDISRVKLLSMEDEEGSDYINASWIPGFHSKREFIASQGPLPSTINDFWRMIWENNCQAIVMLTMCIEKGHIKCEQYWPVQSEPVCYGDVKVEMKNEAKNDEWHMREFIISMGSQSRELIHFHYVSWPDMYVPQRMSLIAFVREIRDILNKSNGKGPIVVHCSAGVGRSGTFIALDTLLHQFLADHDIDVYGIVFQMRISRVLMVQTEAQYVFIYECLKQILEEKDGQGETKPATEGNAKIESCKEEATESDPKSDSKEEQSESKKETNQSNSDSKGEKQTDEPERNTDEAKHSSSNDRGLNSGPEENSTKNESNSNLNFDDSSSKTDDEIKNQEIRNQDLST